MKIINNYGGKRKLIKDVSVGQCFIYSDRLCMKVKSGKPDEYYNNKIVDFENNETNAIADSAEVLVVNAKIVIE